MKFVELEGRDGNPPQSVSVAGMTFSPLDYDQLAAAKLHQPISVDLDWRHARIIETTIAGIDIEGVARGHARLESTHNSAVVSLQQGGWLPSGLAITNGGITILPDRNVVSLIKGRYENGVVIGKGMDFMDLLADQESVSIRCFTPSKAIAGLSQIVRLSRRKSQRLSRSFARPSPRQN